MRNAFQPFGTGSCPFAHVGCSQGFPSVRRSFAPFPSQEPLAGAFSGPFGEPFRDHSFEERWEEREEPGGTVLLDPFGTTVRDTWWDDCA